jgi:hypothetical protein
MMRPIKMCVGLWAMCAALAALSPVGAEAQQVLVQPTRPVQVVRPAPPAAPDWFESNRASQVIRAQEQPHPAPRGSSGLGGAEAKRVYQNYLQGIGSPPLGNSNGSSGAGFGPPTGFGQGGSYGSPQ